MSDFSLKKWYGDAADDQGNVYIGYWVSLQWQNISLHGYQHLWRTNKAGVQTIGSFTKQEPPIWQHDNHLVWQTEHVKADWTSVDDPLHETLYSAERGEITWQCTQPKAQVGIHLPGLTFSGWGYTEYIEITIPVWKLPFNTLYWGRCHTENHYLVWIQWDGATKQNLSWSNGRRRSNDLVITDSIIRGSDFHLELGENIPLRQGQILSTVFKPYSNITQFFPKTTFLVDEQKWYNQGILKINNVSQSAITLYERVLW